MSKKELQLEIKSIAEEIGHIPTKEEVAERTKYSIEIYEKKFKYWKQACAALRSDGINRKQ